MKKKLSIQEYASVAIMLFGMFFGAGNLIFPVHLGQLAGSAMCPAFLGLLITAVGLPLLGVAALGISRSSGLYELGSQIGKPYSLFFTCLLYLTIGPFFAIPRCATTSFTVGLEQVLPAGNTQLFLLLFTLVFFTAALLFSLWPGKILTWVGRVLTPCFLVFLGILVVVALLHPAAAAADIAPSGGYESQPFFTGFLEGYNTMDALASLAFGIVVVQVIRGLGVEDADAVAVTTVKSGVFSCLLMGVIYLAVTLVGVQSRGLFETSANGGVALAQIAQHYLGGAGLLILAATVTLACLKTAVGLITSCSETFSGLFPQGTFLPGLGRHLHPGLPPLLQPGAQRHHQLLRAGADVPLPPLHHPDPAEPHRPPLRPRPGGLRLRHHLHPGGRRLRPPADPAGRPPGRLPSGRLPGRREGDPAPGGAWPRLGLPRPPGPRHRPRHPLPPGRQAGWKVNSLPSETAGAPGAPASLFPVAGAPLPLSPGKSAEKGAKTVIFSLPAP